MTLTIDDLAGFNEHIRKIVAEYLLRRNAISKTSDVVIEHNFFGIGDNRQLASTDILYPNPYKGAYAPERIPAYRYKMTLADDNTVSLSNTMAFDPLRNSHIVIKLHAAKIAFLQYYASGVVQFLACSTRRDNTPENKILRFFGWRRGLWSRDHNFWLRSLNDPLPLKLQSFCENFIKGAFPT